jgi:hypothetical protein
LFLLISSVMHTPMRASGGSLLSEGSHRQSNFRPEIWDLVRAGPPLHSDQTAVALMRQ